MVLVNMAASDLRQECLYQVALDSRNITAADIQSDKNPLSLSQV